MSSKYMAHIGNWQKMIGLDRVWVGEHHEPGTYYRKGSGHEDLFMQGYKGVCIKGYRLFQNMNDTDFKFQWVCLF